MIYHECKLLVFVIYEKAALWRQRFNQYCCTVHMSNRWFCSVMPLWRRQCMRRFVLQNVIALTHCPLQAGTCFARRSAMSYTYALPNVLASCNVFLHLACHRFSVLKSYLRVITLEMLSCLIHICWLGIKCQIKQRTSGLLNRKNLDQCSYSLMFCFTRELHQVVYNHVLHS